MSILNRRRVYGGWGTSVDYSQRYLTFVMLEDTIIKFNARVSGNIYYSTDDGITWTGLASNTNSPTFITGQRVLLKRNSTVKQGYGIGAFITVSGSYNVEGNVMSVLHGDNFYDSSVEDQCFRSLWSADTGIRNAQHLILPAMELAGACYTNMFYNCSITHAPNLPATTLTYGCYEQMFFGCSNLVEIPSILPANILAVRCYYNMFSAVTKITESPLLPAKTLVDSCYYGMFNGCSSIKKITCLATDLSATNCTAYFSRNVQANGTFVKDASITSWPGGSSGIPLGWTVVDYVEQ